MGLVKEKYQQLKPTLEYLSDPIVLAQAWKKTHSYIRSHNWYADTLELDASAINLENNLGRWSQELISKSYTASPIRVVPAPKTDTWSFKNRDDQWEWQPAKAQANSSNNGKDQAKLSEPLRPLAHLTIKDQTIATAMMMCMADAVETAQGPTTSRDVSSFGNRLFCSWTENRARFGWGNSTTYSKYFHDYQRFLQRTATSAGGGEIFQIFNANSPRDLYEVQLDMSAFYDSIDRTVLLGRLREVVDAFHCLAKEETESFWEMASQCFSSWKWHRDDAKLNPCLKLPLKNNGLPQGLVASGFFANAYLLDFDKACRSLIGGTYEGFQIHDYCRYVDDLRLVISVRAGVDSDEQEKTKSRIVEMLQVLLPSGGDLKFNPDKTKILRLKGEESDVSSQMARLQIITSGPMDLDSLVQVENSLDGLFLRAEVALDADAIGEKGHCSHPLATIHQIALDVREDTVLRFAANRWAKILKSKRRLADRNGIDALDASQEALARRFIASWARNPALTLLLKKGLQLFPSRALIEVVWASLIGKLSDRTPIRERYIAIYCLSEICRLSVVDLRRISSADIPKAANLDDYYAFLHEQVRILLQSPNIPWYLKQQAGLLLVGEGSSAEIAYFDPKELLAKVLAISQGHTQGKASDVIPAALVTWQMLRNSTPVIRAITPWMDTISLSARKQSLLAIGMNNPDLLSELTESLVATNSPNTEVAMLVGKMLGLEPALSLSADATIWQGTYPLHSVIQSPANPFIHENALIKLGLALIQKLRDEPTLPLMPQALNIRCDDWKSIQDPRQAFLSIEVSRSFRQKRSDPRYQIPSWIPESGNGSLLYGIGCLLRAGAVSSCDFTASRMLFRQDVGDVYRGLKSSWFKRRTGMMHSPESLAGEMAPMSGWIAELLFNLLQWPGLETENWEENWPDNLDLASLQDLITQRLAHQAKLYGVASNMPIYVHRIKPALSSDCLLRVVTVQTLLPKRNDFEKFGLELNDKGYREKHRGHLADICNIVLKKLETLEIAHDRQAQTTANLIVFPELSVHQDDVDLLEALSAKTKAMIFAGIVFHSHEGKMINRALWLIPYHTNRGGMRWIKRWQGKWNMTKHEIAISPWRPYQLLIELDGTLVHLERGFRLSGAICYDATDMRLTADLRDHSDAFLIAALNNDITTFDNMIDALHYHMYQHVVLVNTGEFGGSAAKAPFKLAHHRQIAHSHGSDQIAISIFDIDMFSLMVESTPSVSGEYERQRKMKPAGILRSGIS